MADTVPAQPLAGTPLDEKSAGVAGSPPPSQPPSSASSFKSTSSQLEPTATSSQNTDATEVSAKAGAAREDEPVEYWTPPPKGETLTTPITRLLPQQKPKPPAPLSPEQETKYATVLAAVSQWQTLPSSTQKGAPQAPIQDHERMWLTRDCLLRYLRATKWHTPSALRRLQSTLSWRREYGADNFTFDYISPENETGKQLVLGYDNEARPCLYLSPAKQNTKMSDRQIHHLCFMLDRTIDMLPPGQESACLLISFDGAGTGNVPTVAQARSVLNILQNHSPERLGKALISKLPWYVTTFFKLISPFIDPVTREKMRFNEDLKAFIPAEMLWDHAGGELKFEYKHEDYWPALEKETKRRKELMRERWVRAGKQVGEYEAYLRGGKHPCLQEIIDRAKAEGKIEDGENVDPSELAAQVGKLSV